MYLMLLIGLEKLVLQYHDTVCYPLERPLSPLSSAVLGVYLDLLYHGTVGNPLEGHLSSLLQHY